MPSNHPQSRDESPTGDKSDCVDLPNIVKSIIAVYTSIFPIRKQPLPGWKRFSFAFVGSLMSFVFGYLRIMGDAITSENKQIQQILDDYTATLFFYTVTFSSYSLIIALVITSSNTRHGPIGLFLFGLMLTAFIVNVSKI